MEERLTRTPKSKSESVAQETFAELSPPKGGATILGRNCTIQTGSMHVDGEIKFEAL